MKNILLLSCCLFLSACDWLDAEWDPTEETIYLDYYKQECDSGLCFRYREDEADSYQSLTEEIAGFTGFEWGTNYTLLVEEQKKGSGRSRDLTFKRVLTETPVGTGSSSTFALTLTTSKGAITVGNGSDVFGIYGEKTFQCESDACTEITDAQRDKSKLSLEFQVDTESAENLLLKEVRCHSADNDFASECEGKNEDTYYIAPFKTECMNVSGAGLCHQFRRYSDGPWQTLEVNITGDFDYQWGQLYQIKVTETFDDTKKRIGFKFESFEEGYPKDPEESSFRLLMRSGNSLDNGLAEQESSSTLFPSYANDSAISIGCESASAGVDCEALNGFANKNDYVALLDLSVNTDTADGAALLLLESNGVRCSQPESSFKTKCSDELSDEDKGFEGKLP